MATYKVRGNAHNVIYVYQDEHGNKKQLWETYATELEAVKRKAHIDYLQQKKMHSEITREALDYRRRSAIAKAVAEQFKVEVPVALPKTVAEEDNSRKTFRDFAEKWLPFHSRKKRFSPNSYDSYRQNMDNHILPYFGDWVMSEITAEDIDDFLDHLSMKPCKGSKSYGKLPEDVPTLSSSSIKKCYTVLTSGFPTAKKWGYIREIPVTTPPAEKPQKRRAWTPEKVFTMLEEIKDDKILHLAVHLAFVCSLRAGETAGIDLQTIDFRDSSLWITRQVQRVSDEAIEKLPRQEVIRVFPKQMKTSKSTLILKGPKTEGSHRKQYLTEPLMNEIEERLAEVQRCKDFFREEYHDYGLLLCQYDGRPLDPSHLEKTFKQRQRQMGIPVKEQIEFQGLRKSGQMHKVRLSQNNYQLVAENSGQSPEVLMSNYNEVLDSEKRALAKMVEASFYPCAKQGNVADADTKLLLMKLRQNPELAQQLLKSLLNGASPAQSSL